MKVAGPAQEPIGDDARRRLFPRMYREGAGAQRAAPSWCSRGVSIVWYRLGRAEITRVYIGMAVFPDCSRMFCFSGCKPLKPLTERVQTWAADGQTTNLGVRSSNLFGRAST